MLIYNVRRDAFHKNTPYKMPLCKRRSRSEMSLNIQQHFQQASSTDHQNREEFETSIKLALSKSDPPKICVENKPLMDVDAFDYLPKIHRAVSDGNLDLLKELVESGTVDINTPDQEGWPPLHTAIKKGKLECAMFLIKKGANDFYDRQYEEYEKRLAVSNKMRNKANSFT